MDGASSIFERALADLEGRMGVKRADLTAADLFALVRACERVANPYHGINVDAAGFPVKVCDGTYFWKLTIGASVWLDEFAGPMFADNPNKYRSALIYSLMNARDPNAFRGMDDKGHVESAVRSACLGICATSEEVNDALDRVLGLCHVERKDVSDAATDWSALCARLESQTGISAHDWMWKHSSSYVVKVYNDLHDFAEAYSVAGKSSGHMRDDLDAAMENLQKIKVEIMRRLNGGANV